MTIFVCNDNIIKIRISSCRNFKIPLVRAIKAFLRFFIKAKIIRGTASIVKATKSTAIVTLVLVLLISSVI